MKSEFIRCACGMEGMGIDYDSDDNLYYISYWSSGLSNKKLSIRERFRYCWNLLRTGKAFNDELVFREEDIDKLMSFHQSTKAIVVQQPQVIGDWDALNIE